MPDVTLFEIRRMVLKMQEKNDREWVVHLVFLSQIVYFVICNIDLQAHVSVINRVGIGVHLTVFTLCSYLALFYLWSYVRVEQYTETYRSTGIFLFSCVFFAEYGLHMWRILFLTVSPRIMYTSLVVFWGIFECTRVLHQYGKNGERDLLQQQFRKDAEVMGGIIVLYICTILLFVLCPMQMGQMIGFMLCVGITSMVLIWYLKKEMKQSMSYVISGKRIGFLIGGVICVVMIEVLIKIHFVHEMALCVMGMLIQCLIVLYMFKILTIDPKSEINEKH